MNKPQTEIDWSVESIGGPPHWPTNPVFTIPASGKYQLVAAGIETMLSVAAGDRVQLDPAARCARVR